MTTTNPPGRHLAVVDTPPPPPPAADVDIDSIVQSLTTLVDLGRAITARASLLLIADPELVLAGQRVEFLAGRAFALIFDAPVGTPIEQL